MRKVGWLLLAVLVLLSVDFWNWRQHQPMWLFMPAWVWQVVAVTLLFSLVFFFIARYEWRDG